LLSAAGSLELLSEAKRAAEEVLDLPTVQNNMLIEEAVRRFSTQSEKIAMN